ncbi:hypothetical protein CFO_g2260 [Ceratocystis platani]|uniref:Uncharacterized protein n=1 Tax=Ceratocystis fimbriata f. sp. platani TaxID=88771 RepID=A0A0F8B4T8_CERFI|nr:hypothetical protein CFO_g2260 [Ceratocystis platani]
MPPQLLPASAAAFAPRASSVNVVLGSRVEPWLTQTLKRINKVKRPLNSVQQHQRCLTETLSSPNATWTLCSLLLTKATGVELQHGDDPIADAMANYSMVHVEAYIVHIDMVLRNEVAFKLTPGTIKILVDHHTNVYCADAKANTSQWPEKESQMKKLHEDFVQAINKYVFRTPVVALEGLEEEGAGELLGGRAEEVKKAILAMMKPLVPPPPPPPRIVDVVHRQPQLSSSSHSQSHANPHWSRPTPPISMPAVEPWHVLPSSTSLSQFDLNASATAVSSAAADVISSSMVHTTANMTSPLWAHASSMEMPELGLHIQDSPPPLAPSQLINSYVPFTTAEMFGSTQPLVSEPITMGAFSNVMGVPCSVGIGAGMGLGLGMGMGLDSFQAWGHYQELPTM